MVSMVAPDVYLLLRDRFGFSEFREGQKEVIDHLLAGRSALAVFPTGSGKSLCYQLPALCFPGVTLVVSPLIALMKDQIDFLQRKGIAAARLDSSIPAEEMRGIVSQLRQNRLKLLYVAPERFANERFLQTLEAIQISMMVVDEAHCISEWGHNFRPDYLKLARHAVTLGIERVLTLTATATPPVVRDICQAFEIRPEAAIQTGFHRPNLHLGTRLVRGESRTRWLIEEFGRRERGATIIYVTVQSRAEEVANALAEAGFPARPYHAGMDPERRTETQEWFMSAENPIVVATIAFGMGIDKANIRYVYHYNQPKSLENYAQEIGRAGRDGLPSHCTWLVDPDDRLVLENFVYGDTPEPNAVEELIGELLALPDEFDLSTYQWSYRYDIRPLVLGTLFTYLELRGILETTAPFYSEYRFQPLRSSKSILARFDERRAKFVRQLFRRAEKRKTWFFLDVTEAAESIGVPREKVIKALNYLEEQGDLTLKVAGVRQGYRFLDRPTDQEGLIQEIQQRFLQREAQEIERIGKVLEFACEPRCLTNRLLEHFGAALPGPCGHCGPCDGEALPEWDKATLAVTIQPEWRQLGREEMALRTPRSLARFLCGISSPKLTRAKLHRHPSFGALAHAPFREVLLALDAK